MPLVNLGQRKLADFLHTRGAHFVFTAKGKPSLVLRDPRRARLPRALRPRTRAHRKPRHPTTRLNGYLTFPLVGQAFLVERTAITKKSGKTSVEFALGITSHTPDTADARRLLELNRGHWKVESVHNMLVPIF